MLLVRNIEKEEKVVIGRKEDALRSRAVGRSKDLRGGGKYLVFVAGIICPPVEIGLRPGICVKYFLSFPQKNLSPEKTATN